MFVKKNFPSIGEGFEELNRYILFNPIGEKIISNLSNANSVAKNLTALYAHAMQAVSENTTEDLDTMFIPSISYNNKFFTVDVTKKISISVRKINNEFEFRIIFNSNSVAAKHSSFYTTALDLNWVSNI